MFLEGIGSTLPDICKIKDSWLIEKCSESIGIGIGTGTLDSSKRNQREVVCSIDN